MNDSKVSNENYTEKQSLSHDSFLAGRALVEVHSFTWPRLKASSHSGDAVGGRPPDQCSQAAPAGLTHISHGLT